MKIFSVINQKGGTAKTTTALNLGAALAALGKKVLLIDLDPQASLSYYLAAQVKMGLQDIIQQNLDIQDFIQAKENFYLLPATPQLQAMENILDKDVFLLQKLLAKQIDFDFIILDCSPSFSLLNQSALLACQYVIVPMPLEVLGLQGLSWIAQSVRKAQIDNPELKILGILLVIVDLRRKVGKEIYEYLLKNTRQYIFDTHIEYCEKAIEAPSFGQSILAYAPHSISGRAYKRLANEILTLINL